MLDEFEATWSSIDYGTRRYKLDRVTALEGPAVRAAPPEGPSARRALPATDHSNGTRWSRIRTLYPIRVHYTPGRTLLNMNSLCEVASTAMSSEETPNSRFDLGTCTRKRFKFGPSHSWHSWHSWPPPSEAQLPQPGGQAERTQLVWRTPLWARCSCHPERIKVLQRP